MADEAGKWDFDQHFQRHFLNHLLRDSDFAIKVKDAISADLFTSDDDRRLAKVTLDYINENGAAPGTLVFSVLKSLVDRNILSQGMHDQMAKYADEMFALGLQNREYLLKLHDDFRRNQLFRRNVIPASRLVQQGMYAEAEELLRECFTTRQGRKAGLGTFYTADPSIRIQRRLGDMNRSFWTLIPSFDRRVEGLKPGELGIAQSQRTSAGKTAFFVHLCRSAIFQRMRCSFYSLEASKDSLEDRLDMNIVGLTKADLLDRNRILMRLRNLISQDVGVYIKQFPGSLTTLEDIRADFNMAASVYNWRPDVVIVDYIGEVAPTKADPQSLFAVGKEVASGLRGWAIEDQIRVWSAIQSNRDAIDASIADVQHSGGSVGIPNIADIVVSINRTPEQEKLGQTTLFVVKQREGAARFPLVIPTNFEKMQFYNHAHTLQAA